MEKSVYTGFISTRKSLEADISAALQNGSLNETDLEFCCIPIVMSPDFIDFYPPRSKFRSGEKKFFHSPQLPFSTFQTGTDKERKYSYIKGILTAIPMLKATGLTSCQIINFGENIKRLL